ncbi:hypothetical protein Tco_1395403, partial [Tanacetum coccineum]
THPSTSQPPVTKEATLMPHESPLQSVHSLGRDEGSSSLNDLMVLYTSLTKKVESLECELKQTKQTFNAALIKLIKRVKKLEQTIKTSQARRRTKIVISDDAHAEEDSSKQGRKISKIDKDPTISLVQDEGMIWFQEDAEIQEKNSTDIKILLEEVDPTELVKDLGSGEKGVKEVSTAEAEFSTAAKNLVYIRRSAQKRKDKGKAIMQESKPLKKIKKRVQVQISIDEELAKKVFEEEQARFNVEQEAKFKAEQEQERIDFETTLKLQKQLDERKEVVAQAHDID